jgi:hypothetical protein
MKEILNVARGILTDLQKSPYRDRIFAVIDSVHGHGLQATLVAMGLPQANIIVWSANGIEHFYPPSVLDSIFGGGGTVSIVGDIVTRNGISYTKADLASRVCALLASDTVHHTEFKEQFLERIATKTL